jgi:demethylmenaquinone methyltransferase/2-methoxy-6-polyprenyl-1,4-benzoquinol methylase
MPHRLDSPDPAAVREMFAAVAPRYDLLNHLLSADLDRRWRQRAAAAVLPGNAGFARGAPLAACPPVSPARRYAPADTQPVAAGVSVPLVVDVCTGTGDLAMAVLRRRRAARVVACDVCRPMLVRARAKLAEANLAPRAAVVEADALALPLPDASADAACCAFGVRNLADEERGLAEMARVVRPGGRVVVLEFHRPQAGGLPAGIFSLYFRRVLPTLGRWISGGRHGGYAYLVRSIEGFGPRGRLAGAMRRAGLADVRIVPLPGGVASLYVGVRPDG